MIFFHPTQNESLLAPPYRSEPPEQWNFAGNPSPLWRKQPTIRVAVLKQGTANCRPIHQLWARDLAHPAN
jgi:hypothetical protein